MIAYDYNSHIHNCLELLPRAFVSMQKPVCPNTLAMANMRCMKAPAFSIRPCLHLLREKPTHHAHSIS